MNLTIVSLSWSHIILNWTSPFHDQAIDFADRYLLIATSNKNNIIITATETHARIDGLKPLTTYLLNVQAGNDLGDGPFLAEDIPFRTPGK